MTKFRKRHGKKIIIIIIISKKLNVNNTQVKREGILANLNKRYFKDFSEKFLNHVH